MASNRDDLAAISLGRPCCYLCSDCHPFEWLHHHYVDFVGFDALSIVFLYTKFLSEINLDDCGSI